MLEMYYISFTNFFSTHANLFAENLENAPTQVLTHLRHFL